MGSDHRLQCPFCQRRLKLHRHFRYHLTHVCWQHCADDDWIKVFRSSIKTPHSDAAERALRQVALKHEKELRKTGSFPQSVDLAKPMQWQSVPMTAEYDDLELSAGSTDDEYPDSSQQNAERARRCLYCGLTIPSQLAYREHLNEVEYEYYEQADWRKEIFSTFPNKMSSGAPVSYISFVRTIKKRLGKHIEPWRPLKNVAYVVRMKADGMYAKSLLDNVLSETILAWIAWWMALENVQNVQVTAELVLLNDLESLAVQIRSRLSIFHDEGALPEGHLEQICLTFEQDDRFCEAYAKMETAVQEGRLRQYIDDQFECWHELVMAWIVNVEKAWSYINNEVLDHAADQIWRDASGQREYTWPRDAVSLFNENEAYQVTVIQCLGMHWAFWLPVYCSLQLFLNQGELEIEREMLRLRVVYALEVAPLPVEAAVE